MTSHGVFIPEVALAILNPLKVGGRDAASVGEDVRDNEDAFVGEDIIRGRGCGAIRAFCQNAAPHAVDVAARDDVFGGGRNQNLAFSGEQFRRITFFCTGESVHGAVLLTKFDQRFDVDSIFVGKAAADFGDTDDFVAGFMHELGSISG